jgi:hypothetical protein
VETALYESRSRSDEDNLVYAPGLLERTSQLGGIASTMPARPTDQMLEVFKMYAPQIGAQIKELNAALTTDLPKVNAALKAAGQPAIVPSDKDVVKPVPNILPDR